MEFRNFFEGELPVVTMDFDHTLMFETGEPNKKTVHEFKKLQKNYEIFIVTTRDNNSKNREEIYNFLKKHNLLASDIIFTNGKDKVNDIKKLNSVMHFDDDVEELKVINQEIDNIETINTFVKEQWNKYVELMNEEKIKKDKTIKVFLGGTTNESTWREHFIKLLDKDKVNYFNPVVSDWDNKAFQKEIEEKETSDFNLYVITPKMKGVYSIAEVVDDSNKQPKKTLFILLYEDDGILFEDFQIKSLDAVKKIIIKNGVKIFNSLEQCASFLNIE